MAANFASGLLSQSHYHCFFSQNQRETLCFGLKHLAMFCENSKAEQDLQIQPLSSFLLF